MSDKKMSDKKMINFNDLPSDIKSLIFKINRHDAFKKKFKKVLNEINEINDKVRYELNKYDDNEGGFFTVDFIKDNNLSFKNIDDICDLGNGCMTCDMFLCTLDNADFYNNNNKINETDDNPCHHMFFFKHVRAYDMMIYLISVTR
jgi:hypothetical protein